MLGGDPMSTLPTEWNAEMENDSAGEMDDALERVRLALLHRGVPPEVFERVNMHAPYALIRLASDLLREQESRAVTPLHKGT